MRLARSLIVLVAALAGSTTIASAQTIRGVVVDPGDRAVPGVVVQMLDSASNVVGRALSNARGEFSVGVGRAGSYRVRTLRIGFRPTLTTPIALPFGGESTQRIVLTGVQLQLDTVRVVDRSSCRVARDSLAAATFAVLDQARTALAAAQLTLAGRTISATTLSYDRVLDPDGRRVLRQTSRLGTAYVAQPWRAITADSVRRAGFVIVDRDNSVTYNAPSIDVLLSNVFLEDHCFRLVSDRKKPGMVGVAFEPSPDRRKLTEVRGTIWLDAKSAELRRLDYRYANVSAEQENAGAGGELEFARLRNGGWAISRWSIRMPVLEQTVRSQALGGAQTHVVEIQVSGGELALATLSSRGVRDTLWSRAPLVLNGTVVDSATGAPVKDGRVTLTGTGLEASTDARGRFSVSGVLPGIYAVETTTPELAAIGATSQASLTFDDSTKTYEIRVPTAAQLAASICPAQSLASGDGAIVGRVFQRGDTVPVKGGRVVAEWTVLRPGAGGGNALDREGRRLEGRTSADGTFRLCGVPVKTALSIVATAADASSEERALQLNGAFARVDLVLDRAASAGATFAGVVLVDSTKTPIAGAEVSIADAGQLTITDASGAFRLGAIPPGEHRVTVRKLGYGPLETTIAFADARTVNRSIHLSRATVLDSVVVSSTSLVRQLADFEEHRKLGFGHFWTRDDLAKIEGRPLASILGDTPGLYVLKGHAGHAWVTASRGGKSLSAMDGRVPDATYRVDPSDIAMGANNNTCYAQVWIDDVRVYTPRRGGEPKPLFDLSSIGASQIEAIEFFAGPGQTPAKYSDLDATCGVLVIHTRRTP